MSLLRRLPRRLAALALCISMLLPLAACSQQRYSATWFDLFDTVTILLGYTSSQKQFDTQAEALKQDLAYYHRLFDIYHSYEGMNNLKTVNDNAGVAPVKVDKPLIDLVLLGKRMYELSGGKMNIGMGSVLSLWHDARTDGIDDPATAALPDMAALRRAAEHISLDEVQVDEEASTLYIPDEKMRLDVGSLGKGYAVELVAQAAEKRGLKSALLSVGGNLRAIGRKPEGKWTGGIENPWDRAATSSLATVELQDVSLVTSGDYQRYYEVDGKRYHHIIDPDTLMPAAYCNAVSVYCPDSGLADGLSTTLFNMSAEDGLALVESLDGVEAMWMLYDETTVQSSGFAAHVRPR